MNIPATDATTNDSYTIGQGTGLVIFTPDSNETYTVSSSRNESGTTEEFQQHFFLSDTASGAIFTEFFQRSTDVHGNTYTYSDVSGSPTGVLLAGHTYRIELLLALQNAHNGPGTATGEFHFGAAPAVPEPSSIFLIGLGTLTLIAVAYCRFPSTASPA